MPVFWVLYSSQDQSKLVQDLKGLGDIGSEEIARLELIERHLTDYGFMTDDETKSLQNILDEYGWRLD